MSNEISAGDSMRVLQHSSWLSWLDVASVNINIEQFWRMTHLKLDCRRTIATPTFERTDSAKRSPNPAGLLQVNSR